MTETDWNWISVRLDSLGVRLASISVILHFVVTYPIPCAPNIVFDIHSCGGKGANPLQLFAATPPITLPHMGAGGNMLAPCVSDTSGYRHGHTLQRIQTQTHYPDTSRDTERHRQTKLWAQQQVGGTEMGWDIHTLPVTLTPENCTDFNVILTRK